MISGVVYGVLVMTCISAATAFIPGNKGIISTTRPIDAKSVKIYAIEDAATTVLACEPALPGLAVGVVHDGEVFLSSGFGYSNPFSRYRQRVNADTLFGIASITKSFAASLALQTLENAKLDRNAKVADLLGKDFRFRDDLLTQQVTVGDLLSHRTGIPDYNFVRFQTNYSRESILRDMAYLKNTGAFRDSYLYSNIGYGLAAHITELLDKNNRTWEDMVSEELFAPLGMRRSYLRGQNAPRTNVAVPHFMTLNGDYGIVSQDFLKHWGNIGASGSVMTSASDMTRWMRLLLRGGLSTTGDRILSEDVIKTLFRPVVANEWNITTPIKPDAPETLIFPTYASGFRIGFYRGYKIAAHGGSTYGYTALMTLIPSKNIGVFIAFNGYDWHYRARIPLTLYILDILLGKDPWLDNKTLCTFPSPWGKPRTSPRDLGNFSTKSRQRSNFTEPGNSIDTTTASPDSVKLSLYSGKYFTPGFGELVVSLHSVPNRLTLEYGVLRAMLVPEQVDNFTMYGEGDTWFVSDSLVVFLRDGHRIKSVQIYGFSQKPVFIKQ